jgi:hypothetical protein
MSLVDIYKGFRADGRITGEEMSALRQAVLEANALQRENGQITAVDDEALDLFVTIWNDMDSFAFNRPRFDGLATERFHNFFRGVESVRRQRCAEEVHDRGQYTAGLIAVGGISVTAVAVYLLPGPWTLLAIIPGLITLGAFGYHQHVERTLPDFCHTCPRPV